MSGECWTDICSELCCFGVIFELTDLLGPCPALLSVILCFAEGTKLLLFRCLCR